MELVALPAFTDNRTLMWHEGARARGVDPGDAAVVVQALEAHVLHLAAILVTHHHGDHPGDADARHRDLKFEIVAGEPHNRDIVAHSPRCEDEPSRGRPTLPSTIERERSINPFLRCTQPDVAASAGAHGASSREPVAVFAALLEWKNRF